MDLSAHTAPVEFEIVRENQVDADSEFSTETVFRADTWTRLRTPPLLPLKLSMKTESLQTQKSSPKRLPELTHGFVSAHRPCWLRNSEGKLSRYRLRIHHRNWFPSWHMDLLVHTTFFDSGIVNESLVTADLKIITETASRADAWTRQRTHPCALWNSQRKLSRCWLRNHHWNCLKSWRMDSTSPTAPVNSETVKENWVVTD
jgi:hypothetical protein